ncbi:hypothetical protein K503DRAFT_802086 [Rhizopogon vinicolor AM-OR11-026]|uniref:Acetyl-CoA synthetase-like protein n=1 Tax=Rhizopogon vinicolor AM-OR11-026 TaxID=1314800 RepID=A0A1B7MUY1_9AGAM|nr:hypothetical protein K503DRAFT_802086 [Rhizopogon vinicolor AM-OR11-026]
MTATSPKSQCPPLDGSLLFPDMQKNASLPMYIFPDPQDSNALASISFRKFCRARMEAGLIITGIVPFPLATHHRSWRTTSPNQNSIHYPKPALLHDVRCLFEGSGGDLTIFEIPSLSEVYSHLGNESLVHPFAPYSKRSSPIRITETAIYLHTSRTIGYPKHVAQSHMSQINWLNAPILWQYRIYPSIRLGAMTISPFHVVGVAAHLYSMLIGVTGTLVAPTSVRDRLAFPPIPTSDNIIECVRQTGTNIVGYVVRGHFFNLSRTVLLTARKGYGGGPLSKKTGDFLCRRWSTTCTDVGMTKFPPISIANGSPNWRWIEFSDTVDIRWAPRDLDLYECQVLRSDNLQLSIANLPDAVRGYTTNDLFVRHLTHERLWKIVSRMDDVVVLSTGEKTVPSHTEAMIACCPYLNDAIMFGSSEVKLEFSSNPVRIISLM